MSLAICMSPTKEVPSFLPSRHPGFSGKSMRTTDNTATAGRSALLFDQDSVLQSTPVEIILEVFKHLDLKTAFRLGRVNKAFHAILKEFRVSILLSIMKTEFSPFAGLLQVVKASPLDLDDPWGTWLGKRVRRNNKILCEGAALPKDLFFYGSEPKCREVVLSDSDVNHLLEVCRVVKGWERIFPQHRFQASPVATRSLTDQENERLRRALYTWMRYSYYFHADLRRPNLYIPAGNDLRANFLRILSNSELRELKDLWLTVEDIVELKLCPSTDNVCINAVSIPATSADDASDLNLPGLSAVREPCSSHWMGGPA